MYSATRPRTPSPGSPRFGTESESVTLQRDAHESVRRGRQDASWESNGGFLPPPTVTSRPQPSTPVASGEQSEMEKLKADMAQLKALFATVQPSTAVAAPAANPELARMREEMEGLKAQLEAKRAYEQSVVQAERDRLARENEALMAALRGGGQGATPPLPATRGYSSPGALALEAPDAVARPTAENPDLKRLREDVKAQQIRLLQQEREQLLRDIERKRIAQAEAEQQRQTQALASAARAGAHLGPAGTVSPIHPPAKTMHTSGGRENAPRDTVMDRGHCGMSNTPPTLSAADKHRFQEPDRRVGEPTRTPSALSSTRTNHEASALRQASLPMSHAATTDHLAPRPAQQSAVSESVRQPENPEVALTAARDAMRQQLTATAAYMQTVDLVLVMDCTRSMDRWIEQAKDRLLGVVKQVLKTFPGVILRVGFVGYRDHCDKQDRLVTMDLTSDAQAVRDLIARQRAFGGGDEPEDVTGGLHAALAMDWRANAKAIVHVADAPAHGVAYHDAYRSTDDYPEGDPYGLRIEDLMARLGKKDIDYTFFKISASTDKMLSVMRRHYDSAKDMRDIAVEELGVRSDLFGERVFKSVARSMTRSAMRSDVSRASAAAGALTKPIGGGSAFPASGPGTSFGVDAPRTGRTLTGTGGTAGASRRTASAGTARFGAPLTKTTDTSLRAAGVPSAAAGSYKIGSYSKTKLW